MNRNYPFHADFVDTSYVSPHARPKWVEPSRTQKPVARRPRPAVRMRFVVALAIACAVALTGNPTWVGVYVGGLTALIVGVMA